MAKSKKEEKKKRLRLLILLLFVTIVMLATSTYAWFTANRTVSIAPIDVYVEASSGLQISTDAVNWKTLIQNSDITSPTAYSGHKNMKPTTLVPVSTAGERDSNGYLKFFKGVVNGATGDLALTANATPEEGTYQPAQGNFTNGDKAYFIAFDIFLKVDKSGGEDVYLDAGSGVLSTSGESDKHLQYASRYAFVQESSAYTEGTVEASVMQGSKTGVSAIIIEPNYDAHVATGVTAASNYYKLTTSADTEANLKSGASTVAAVPYLGVKAQISTPIVLLHTANGTGASPSGSYFEAVTTNATHVRTNTAYSYNEETHTFKVQENGTDVNLGAVGLYKIFHLNQGITKYRVYMWVEGQDVDCENNASGANLTYKLGLTLGPES